MKRITLKQLESLVDRINEVKKTPMKPWETKCGKYKSNIGNYHLDFAYGGVAMYQMVNDCGAVEDIFRCGHTTKRDLYNRLDSFLIGCK